MDLDFGNNIFINIPAAYKLSCKPDFLVHSSVIDVRVAFVPLLRSFVYIFTDRYGVYCILAGLSRFIF